MTDQNLQVLEKTINKVSQVDYEKMDALYQSKKSQVTLDDKQAIIVRLSQKFPLVCVAGGGYEVEFCAATVERILNEDCKFNS